MDDETHELLLSRPPGHSLCAALDKFLNKDLFLLEIDANERSITHRIAMYIQDEFPEWDVDCEYNRDEHKPKELNLPGGEPDSYDVDAQTVYPDIIVHKRGSHTNHIVIEFKKTSSRIGAHKDFIKLAEYRRQLHYEYALFIELAVGAQRAGIHRVVWFDE